MQLRKLGQAVGIPGRALRLPDRVPGADLWALWLVVLRVRGQDARLTSRLLVPVQATRQVRAGWRWQQGRLLQVQGWG
ncbi:hypothetical protein GCM10017784_38960 [Deinococcus indicus]|nr:hypothetical protein GCM10017784_38960 [Deinococcus indicus]